MLNYRGNQTGVALITILLVFALIAVIAQSVLTRGYRDIRRTGNMVGDEQAYRFALAGEQYARQILYRDFVEGESRGELADGLEDGWADNFEPFNIDGGAMTIEIIDAQSLFNINNLVDDNGSLNPQAAGGFRRLLNQLSIAEDYTHRIVDWIDPDNTPISDGGEDASYQSGYLPANRPLTDKTELRLIRGMNSDDYLALAPHIVALPGSVDGSVISGTKYNINTVSATLLQALSGMSAFEVQDIADLQERGGFVTLEDWLVTSAGGGLRGVSGQLGVASAFFEVTVKAQYQERISTLTSLIYRDPENGQLTILKRRIGPE